MSSNISDYPWELTSEPVNVSSRDNFEYSKGWIEYLTPERIEEVDGLHCPVCGEPIKVLSAHLFGNTECRKKYIEYVKHLRKLIMKLSIYDVPGKILVPMVFKR